MVRGIDRLRETNKNLIKVNTIILIGIAGTYSIVYHTVDMILTKKAYMENRPLQ